MKPQSTAFNIHIIDNFLPKKIFLKLLNHIPDIEWEAKNTAIQAKHIWFGKHISFTDPVAICIKDCIKSKTPFLIKEFNLLSFTMQGSHKEPLVHCDGPAFDNQLLLYLDGNTDINKGTGFYVKNGEELVLNTHIGFYKNRAILFKTGIWHAPLLFNATDSIPRIAIIAQF